MLRLLEFDTRSAFHLWFSKRLLWQWRARNRYDTPFTCAIYFSQEWLIEHCASELTQIAGIIQTRPLNSTSDRKRSFLVNGPSVARGRFLSHRGREIRVDRERTIENELSEEMNRYFTPTSAGIKFCGLFIAAARFVGSLSFLFPFPFVRTVCNNSSLPFPHISGQWFTSWNSPYACQFLR